MPNQHVLNLPTCPNFSEEQAYELSNQIKIWLKPHEITDKKIWEETVLGRPEANFTKLELGRVSQKFGTKGF